MEYDEFDFIINKIEEEIQELLLTKGRNNSEDLLIDYRIEGLKEFLDIVKVLKIQLK